MKYLLLSVLLFGCNPQPDCVTTEGLSLYGNGDDVADANEECEPFQERVSAGIQFLTPIYGDEFAARLFKWKVTFANHVDADGYYQVPGVMGLAHGHTDCQEIWIVLGWGEHDTWKSSELVHEMIHASNMCADADHYRWKEDGVFTAIYKANGGTTP